ncbi:uncharacterized protein PGTG_03383 [Puccinia graminis f. sp. tritici CRL 75-36-700-3]|uniref:Uncharacterized protein n=1 Tax=Puccinia graminis f. sp. tritici (strain CRL 75-36-700-3 / race SCCL) TaxID=418459 RepID=E3JZF2_PUCGT|nr:uncharacterized protein PGTG_03383 [Puccinia graminis f. sp. tritici CRL 75-36-700-3]EFP77427.2 hypothetical protein PGTG_03383 [Puccinia graminis f. sp. tritici CRL 75-36-700-3]
MSSLNKLPSSEIDKTAEKIGMKPAQRTVESPVKQPGKQSAEEYCPLVRPQKRSLVLVRRGCFGRLGSGLISLSDELSRAGADLKELDKLNFRQKIEWLRRRRQRPAAYGAWGPAKPPSLMARVLGFIRTKTRRAAEVVMRGTRHAISRTSSAVGRAVSIPIFLVFKAASETIRSVGRLALHVWKHLGKGLAATGRGLQKAGDLIQSPGAPSGHDGSAWDTSCGEGKLTGSAVGRGALLSGYLAYKAGSETLKAVGRVALYAWKYLGKGLAATGRGLNKAGDGIQAHTAARLAKKIPATPSETSRGLHTGIE